MRPIHDARRPAVRTRRPEVAADAATLGTAFGMEVSLGEPAPLARAPHGAAPGLWEALRGWLARAGAARTGRR